MCHEVAEKHSISVIGPLAGGVGLIFIDRNSIGGLLAAYYFVKLYSAIREYGVCVNLPPTQLSSIEPLLYSWSNSNAAGTTKQRTLGAVLFIFQCAGNVVGPQVCKSNDTLKCSTSTCLMNADLDDEAPIYHTGITVDVCCWGGLILCAGIMAVYLKFLNRRQAKRREARGQVGEVLDTSIMTLEEAAVSAAAQIFRGAAADLTGIQQESPSQHDCRH